MTCRTGPGKRKTEDAPIQYVPPEEKKTVIESPRGRSQNVEKRAVRP